MPILSHNHEVAPPYVLYLREDNTHERELLSVSRADTDLVYQKMTRRGEQW